MDKTQKHSKQRDYLLTIVKNTKSHPDANWIYAELKKKFPNAGLATVYRNLRQLTEKGELMKIDTGSGIEHYDATTENHYHFVCEKCSAISDVDISVLDWLDGDLSSRLDAEVKRHSLIFYGACSKCRS